jgi:L-alanine-DL-glutamate epimerase-like enolase superfamily enzyme
MEITGVTVHTIALPEVEASRADGTQDAAIIEVETDEGITGVGEADSSPPVVDAIVNAPVSHDKSAGLEEVVIGRDPFDVDVLWKEMFDRTYYYGRKGAAITAMSGIDMALWDIKGKALDQPVHSLLGGKYRDSVPAYVSTLFPTDPSDTERMRNEARAAQEYGASAIKYGWGCFGQDHDADHALLSAAREVLGDSVDLMVDAGMVWEHDVKQARKRTNDLDRQHDLFWVEEPVYAENLSGYARLSEACDTRIVGGEEEYTVYGFEHLIDHGRIDAVQPDAARSGGITQMNKIATIAQNAGIPVYPHGFSTDIVIAANLQIVAANQNAPLIEYSTADSPIRWDVTEEDFGLERGRIEIPDDPGLGVTLDRDTISTYETTY